MIYLDHNATTPVAPAVLTAMLPYLQAEFGNPSSAHRPGVAARRAVEAARRQVAALIGAGPEEIRFTSGGTEANNLAILGLAGHSGSGHLIATAVEHPAVLEPCRELQRRGWALTLLPVDSGGVVDPEKLRRALRPDTRLVACMLVNNEVGAIQPVAEIARIARERGIPVHCDAVQAAGKLPVDVGQLGVDSLSLSGHKFYGPKGTGALYVRSGLALRPVLFGGGQERGLRPGTENVPGIVGLGAAAAAAAEGIEDRPAHFAALRWHLLGRLAETVPDWRLNGDPQRSLGNTVNITLQGVRGEAVATALALRGICISVGSACSSTSPRLSHVLQAMGLGTRAIRGAIRISMGIHTTAAELDAFVEHLAAAVARLRRVAGGAAG